LGHATRALSAKGYGPTLAIASFVAAASGLPLLARHFHKFRL